jgi:predicted ArsR family transcriptional regulator
VYPALPPPPPAAPSGYVPRRGAHDRAAILTLLETGPRRLWELAEGSSSYKEAIVRQLRKLLADGLVERIAPGLYALRARSAAE